MHTAAGRAEGGSRAARSGDNKRKGHGATALGSGEARGVWVGRRVVARSHLCLLRALVGKGEAMLPGLWRGGCADVGQPQLVLPLVLPLVLLLALPSRRHRG